nr:hypothetical protein Iba_scaffold8840CG0200 [Ipomoea batatas]
MKAIAIPTPEQKPRSEYSKPITLQLTRIIEYPTLPFPTPEYQMSRSMWNCGIHFSSNHFLVIPSPSSNLYDLLLKKPKETSHHRPPDLQFLSQSGAYFCQTSSLEDPADACKPNPTVVMKRKAHHSCLGTVPSEIPPASAILQMEQ